MTGIWKRIYKENVVDILKELVDIQYQKDIWLNQNNPNNWIGSFTEAANMLFDDCVIGDYLKDGEIILDARVTQALWELSAAVDAVNEYRDEEEIINDPLMEVVREKAARALFLINVSTYEGSTVDIATAGQSYPGEVVR